MATPREHRGGNKRRGPIHPAHTSRRGDEDEVSRTHTESSVPGTSTFSISNDGSAPRRQRRQYTPEERRQVAERRKIGCTHDPPSNATAKFKEDTQSHEMFALGMTTPSVAANEQWHLQAAEQTIATIDNQFNTTQKTCTQQPIGGQRPKMSERNLRSDVKKSELGPLRPNPGLSRSRKSIPTIHHDQEPALPKPGLEQGFNKPFRFKDDRKPKQGSRRPKAKSMTPSNTGPMYPKALIHEKAEDQITPSNISHPKQRVLIVSSPCHPPFSGGVQPHLPHIPLGSVAGSKTHQVGYPDTIPGYNNLLQPILASVPRLEYPYFPDAGLQRGPPPSLRGEGAAFLEQYCSPNLQAGIKHCGITSQPQFPHHVISISQPQHLPELTPPILYYKGQPQPLENNAGYVQSPNEDIFTNLLKDDWDQITVVAESLELDPSFESSGIASGPKLVGDGYAWLPIGGFANNTQDP